MNSLGWLEKRRFRSATRRENDWVFSFENDLRLTVECLWRLLNDGRIRVTSEDDGQKFGRPAPVEAAAEVSRCLGDALVEEVVLRQGTLDIEMRFSTGHVLQVLPDSSGYESWETHYQGKLFVATGGGELAIYDDPNHHRG